MQSHATEFVSRRWLLPRTGFTGAVRSLTGGLESAVGRATVTAERSLRNRVPRRFVIKELRGMQRREAVVYARLWAHAKRPPAARVLGSVADEDAHYLYLEEVRPAASGEALRAWEQVIRRASAVLRPSRDR